MSNVDITNFDINVLPDTHTKNRSKNNGKGNAALWKAASFVLDRNGLSADSEDFGSALRAFALGGWLSVLHRDLLGVLYLYLLFAFYAVSFRHIISPDTCNHSWFIRLPEERLK
jgi:hypothetical protein